MENKYLKKLDVSKFHGLNGGLIPRDIVRVEGDIYEMDIVVPKSDPDCGLRLVNKVNGFVILENCGNVYLDGNFLSETIFVLDKDHYGDDISIFHFDGIPLTNDQVSSIILRGKNIK